MLHPILDVSNFNVVLSVLGLFILLFSFLSLKVKQRWYLGEALPAFVVGVIFGPVGARFLNVNEWGGDDGEKRLTRLVIGIQLVKAGYELPKRYLKQHLVEMTICLFPLMTISWLATSACIVLMVPHISFLAALTIASCVTCTDPILSQAIAKGPFADNYVRRPLREFISSEAGGNDGFGFPFLLLAVSLLRYAESPDDAVSLEEFDLAKNIPDLLDSSNVGRFGGGTGRALEHWAVEGLLYMIVLGTAYGGFVGFMTRTFLNMATRKRLIDNEYFQLAPLAIGLFIVGTCGCFGSDETLACFIAGSIMNWDGHYHSEIQARHGSFNSTLDSLLNLGLFMYLGAIMPWDQFHLPDSTGITISRLFALGFLVLVFRRIPAIMLGYWFMPKVCGDWKEAFFMGYFGPIGVGSISYVEYARRLFPRPGQSDIEINHLTAAMTPVVYWLVFFSIVIHGLSVPTLNILYTIFKVPRICDHPVEIMLLSDNEPLPNNSTPGRQRHSVIVNNQFTRGSEETEAETGRNDTESERGILRHETNESCEMEMDDMSTKECVQVDSNIV